MSHREEVPTVKPTSNSSQPKSTANSKHKTSGDELNSNRKARLDSVEDLYRSKGSHSERSGPNDDMNIVDKYAEVIKQLKRFFDEFKGYALTHEIKDKIVEVVKNYREEDPLQILKCMNYIVQLLAKTPKKEDYDSRASEREEHQRLSYEELLQKAENDIRQHIRIEQQLKLLIDNMQAKLDEYELNEGNTSPQSKKESASTKEVRAEVARLTEVNQQKDKEIANLQKLLKKKDDTIKAFDEQLSNIPLLEHKLRSVGERYRAEKENICSYYEQEYANLTKEVQHIHRVLNINIETEEKVKLLQEELLSYKDFNVKKAHILENKIKQLNNNYDKDGESRGKEDTDFLTSTEPAFEDRRYSARPSTTSTSVLKSRGGYDLQTHRCSTEMSRNSENRNSSKSIPAKKKRDFINEMKSTPVLAARTMSRLNMRGDSQQQQQQQPQQGAPKTQREVESYFNYLKRRLDNLQNVNEKERETLRSADGRRSSSAKRGAYLTTSSTSMRKDKSYEKLSKVDITKVQEEKSDYISSERAHHTKSVPKLRPSASIAHVKALKH